MFTTPLPSKGHIHSLDYSGLQPSCHNYLCLQRVMQCHNLAHFNMNILRVSFRRFLKMTSLCVVNRGDPRGCDNAPQSGLRCTTELWPNGLRDSISILFMSVKSAVEKLYNNSWNRSTKLEPYSDMVTGNTAYV
jgi:hypothetical protein